MALCWKHLPKWQRDNEFIIHGYRKPSYSYSRSVRDTKTLHNETVNIWSHLLAAILFVTHLIRFVIECGPLSRDVVVVLNFFLGVITCFGFSSVYHLFSNHSRRIASLCQRLDHLGVVIVIWSSAVSFVYFAFHCDRLAQRFHITLVTTAALASAIFAYRPKFRHPKSRPLRTFTYFVLGCCATLPAIHLSHVDEKPAYQRTVLASYQTLASLNSLAGLIYAVRVPERFCRGTFDIFGSSHQIMHILVICGAQVYTKGLLTAREYWHNDINGMICPAAMEILVKAGGISDG
jgi:adiponectin receptor